MSALSKISLLLGAVSFFSATTVNAQHGPYLNPWVESIAASATNKYSAWYHHTKPDGYGKWLHGTKPTDSPTGGYAQSSGEGSYYGSSEGAMSSGGARGPCQPAKPTGSNYGPGHESGSGPLYTGSTTSAGGWGGGSGGESWVSPGGSSSGYATWTTTTTTTTALATPSTYPWNGASTLTTSTSASACLGYGCSTTVTYASGYPTSSSTISSTTSANSYFTSSSTISGTTSAHSYSTSSTVSGTTSTTSYSTSSSTVSSTTSATSPTGTCAYWLDEITHQGVAPYASSANYAVYRNVKDYGAAGDGVTDDTAAIQSAISTGGRCAPGTCNSTTTTPAVVYFPPGTYLISASIVDYYYTQLIGNPNCMPTILAAADFTNVPGTIGLIDGDPYGQNGPNLDFGATNVFWRQVRNFYLDMTNVPLNQSITGIHWPTGQATSLQNIVFEMSNAPGTQHVGVNIEQGSGGFMTDLVFNGGLYGANWGNQQFTTRNMTFNGCVTAINQIWDWGWTYFGLSINNCSTGINMTGGGTTAQSVGSVVLFDSEINDTPVGIATAHSSTSQPPAAGSLILENVATFNVPIIVEGADGTDLPGLAGAAFTVSAWAEGHVYDPTGPTNYEGFIAPNNRPGSLLNGDNYYVRSKPQYGDVPVTSFISARDSGAKGDGTTDDTEALQGAINDAASSGGILFIDYGVYVVTSTLTIPPGARIVGESYSVILGAGDFFGSMESPQPIVQIGESGQPGSVELSDLIVSTRGAAAGAILFEFNMISPLFAPSGLWDVHARIGGFAGSDLQLANCPTTPDVSTPPAAVNTNCIAAFMTFHVTPQSSGLYLENVWLWTADHDVEDPDVTQITIYTGRGLFVESTAGAVWLYGTAVEHHAMYEYQFANTQAVVMGFIQTETAYYQPNPPAPQPFTSLSQYSDPIFPAECYSETGAQASITAQPNSTVANNCDGFGLRILDSQDLLVYGAGFYSFFDNYNVTCSNQGNGETCQTQIFTLDGTNSGISVYALSTVGVTDQITDNGAVVAVYSDNLDGFVDTIAVYRSDSVAPPNDGGAPSGRKRDGPVRKGRSMARRTHAGALNL